MIKKQRYHQYNEHNSMVLGTLSNSFFLLEPYKDITHRYSINLLVHYIIESERNRLRDHLHQLNKKILQESRICTGLGLNTISTSSKLLWLICNVWLHVDREKSNKNFKIFGESFTWSRVLCTFSSILSILRSFSFKTLLPSFYCQLS